MVQYLSNTESSAELQLACATCYHDTQHPAPGRQAGKQGCDTGKWRYAEGQVSVPCSNLTGSGYQIALLLGSLPEDA